MKKTVLLIAALAAGASSLQAQDSTYSVTLDFSYASDYIFRGVKLADDVITPSVEFASGDFYAGIWSAQPVTKSQANEFDFYAGYGWALSDTWSLDAGATYYYYPEIAGTNYSFEPFVGVAGALGGLDSSFYLYYDTELEILTYQGSLGYSVPVSDVLSLDLFADLGYADVDGGGSYTYWDLGASFGYAMTDAASAYFGVTFATNDIDGADDSFFFFTTGVTVGF